MVPTLCLARGVVFKSGYDYIVHSSSAIYVWCRCHQLQLATLNAADEHKDVKRVVGTLLTIWKAFHYSPKKTEKLARVPLENASVDCSLVQEGWDDM